MRLLSVLVHRVHLRTGFYNPFVCHDSGISPQKIRNVNKVPFLLEPFTYLASAHL